MTHQIRRSLILLVGSGAFAMSAMAEHSGFSRGYISRDTTPVFQVDRQPVPGSFSHATDFGLVAADVQYNDVRAVVSTTSPKTQQRYSLDSALAQGYLVDQVTIEAPGLDGQSGSVVFEFRLTGSISASGGSDPDSNTYAQYRYQLSIGSVVTEFGRYVINTNGTTEGSNVLNQNRQLTTGMNFSAPTRILWDNQNDTRTSRFVGSAGSVETQFSIRVVKVLDRNGKEVKDYRVTSHSGAHYGASNTGLWAAGRDLARNERLDRPEEKPSTNAGAPAWSYGIRESALGTSFAPFTPEQHQNGVGHPDVDGWVGDAAVLANTSGGDVTLNLGGSTSKPVLAGQLIMRPSATQLAVARWTAPEKGTYNIAARWSDVDASGGDGAAAHVTINGVEVVGDPSAFNANGEPALAGLVWQNGGRAEMPPQSFRLEAGDKVDFLVGAAGNATADSTAFNAIIRRAPEVTISAPASLTEGENLVVTAAPGAQTELKAVAFRVNGVHAGVDTSAPFELVQTGLTRGVYRVEAEAIDTSRVFGASNPLVVTVNDGAQPTASASRKGEQTTREAAISGSTYEAITSGLWSQADIWRRKSDGANGVPGPQDVAIVGRAVQITLTEDVTVGKLYCDGRVAGDSGNTRELTINEHFDVFGLVRDLTVNIPQGGVLTAVKGVAFLENAKINNRGTMILSQSFFAAGSTINNEGTLRLRTPPASGGPVTLALGHVDQRGNLVASAGTKVLADSVTLDGTNNLIGMDGASLVGPDGASILSQNGVNILSQNGVNILSQNGVNLIGMDGASLVGPDGASLVGPDGASLGHVNAASIISRDGAGIKKPELIAGKGGERAELAAESVRGIVLHGGTLSGIGNIVGPLTNAAGFVSPGFSGGVIRVIGNYSQGQNGTLLMELGGTNVNPPQFDQLQVAGTASLDGNLIVKTIGGFTPQSGDAFLPLAYRNVSGNFATISSNAQVAFDSNGMTLQVSGANPPAPKALNIATRMRVETGDNVLIAGFIITGSQPKRVLVRGIGPSLPVDGALADPTLDLDGGAFFNDDWRSDQQGDIEATTIPPSNDRESAIVATLQPGAHTAVLRGKDDGTGVGLVEVYDLETGSPVQLANISTRGQVQTGDDVMIGGFIIGGNYPAKVLIRAIGPSLPVSGALQDPTLELVDSNGATISNDSWRATQEAEIIATSVPPTNDREAAIVATLVPGAYTAVVRGKDDTVGVALVEGYNLQ